MNNKEFYSNCLLEAIKAKVKLGKEIKIIHIKSKDGLHHWVWHDLKDGNIYDFQQLDTIKHWHDLIYFRGRIRIRPYSVYENFLKEKQEVGAR